jgi:hypothetical protein
MVPALEIELPLRLKVCPRCDYSLLGLPAVGACPECGRPYDQLGVYLYGEAAGNHRRSWTNVPRKRSSLIWQGLFIDTFCGFFLWQNAWHHVRIFSFFLPAQFMIPFAIVLWRSFSDQGSGIIQVKLTPDGVRQGIRGLGPFPYEKCDTRQLIPWQKIHFVELKRIKDGRVQVRMNSIGRWWQYRREYVNAYVHCTPQELEALKVRVDQWRASA